MLKLPRSKNGSPIPAYSQSTMRIRAPSSMKLALSRSLWHGRSSSGLARQASSIRRPMAAASSYSGGMRTPRAAASARYASTIRSGTNRPGMGGPSWMRRSEVAMRSRVSGRWTASSLTGEPSMNFVTR